MKYRTGILSLCFAILMSGCPRQAVTPDERAARAALIDAYEARLQVVMESSGPTCPEVLEALRAEEARWATVWKRANVPPEPPRALTCP